jgi:putative addiction module component (TIGR02574 family)
MERKLEEIASEALALSIESRAALAKRLLDSLDDLAPEECERMWVEESALRYEQLKAGLAKSLPSEEVFARLDARPRPDSATAFLPRSRPQREPSRSFPESRQ